MRYLSPAEFPTVPTTPDFMNNNQLFAAQAAGFASSYYTSHHPGFKSPTSHTTSTYFRLCVIQKKFTDFQNVKIFTWSGWQLA